MRALLAVALLLVASFAAPAQEGLPEVVRVGLESAFRDLEAGRLDAAIGRYEVLAAEHPGIAEIQLQLGAAYFQADRIEEALTAWNTGLEAEPRSPSLLRNATAAASRLGRFDEAAEFARRGLEVSGDDLNMLAAATTAFQRAGLLDEAAASLDRLSQLQDGNPTIWYNLGTVQLRRGQTEAAVRAFRRSLDLDPERYRAAYNLGAALEELGRTKDAIEVYEDTLKPIRKDLSRGRQVEAAHAVGLSRLAILLEGSGEESDAVKAWDDAVRAAPEESSYALGRGLLAARIGDDRQASTSLSRALELDPSSLAQVVVPLCQAKLRLGDSKGALEVLAKGLSQLEGEDRDRARNLMVSALRETGDSEGAATMLQELVAEDPSDVALVSDLASLLEEIGNADRAKDVLRAGWLASGDVGLAFELARRLEPSAEREVLAAVISRSEDAEATSWAAARAMQLDLEAGRVDQAREVFAAIELERLSPGAAAEVAAAGAVLMLGRGAETTEAKQLLASVEPTGPIRALLGAVVALEGDDQSARQNLENALEGEAGELPWAQAARGNLQGLYWVAGDRDALQRSLDSSGRLGAGVALATGSGGETDLAALESDRDLVSSADRLTMVRAGRSGEAMTTALADIAAQMSLRSVIGELAALQRRRPGALLDGSTAASLRRRLPRDGSPLVALVEATISLLAGDEQPQRFSGLALEGEASAVAGINRAVALAKTGEVDAAVRILQSITEPVARYNLGVLLDYNGDKAGAERAYRAGLSAPGVDRAAIQTRIEELSR